MTICCRAWWGDQVGLHGALVGGLFSGTLWMLLAAWIFCVWGGIAVIRTIRRIKRSSDPKDNEKSGKKASLGLFLAIVTLIPLSIFTVLLFSFGG